MTAAVVLFEGCGGATRGLADAGYTTTGFDHWQPAVTCAQANGHDAHLHDLSDPTGDHLVPYAPLWWASPPCQPFSAAGDGEGEFDDRDGFPWLLRLTALRLPDVLLIENVKGLTFRKHSAYFCAVLEGFRALGYDVDWRVLCAADFGVPQTRERCIIVCRRDGGPITWPMPTHTETGGMFTHRWVTMAEALDWDCPDAMTLHYRQTNAAGELITCDLADRPAPTIGTQSQSQWIIETPAATIRLSTTEIALLQGFPADWTWTGNKTQQARMIGNACPAALTEAIVAANRPAARKAAA